MIKAPALALHGISKSYGRVTALSDVSMIVRPGTVHALLGENGAGKSTLMRVAFGLTAADAGYAEVNGVRLNGQQPSEAIAHGLGMVHQHFSLVNAMTVAENVALGNQGIFTHSQVAEEIRLLGERTGLIVDPNSRVSELPVSAQQRCEIVKALSRSARVLILDEPTAVLAPEETQALLKWTRDFVAQDPSHAVVLITHKLRDALAVADDVTVLRRGHRVAAGPASLFTELSLADAMLGPTERTLSVEAEVLPAERRSRQLSNTDEQGAANQNTEHTDNRDVVLDARTITVNDERGVARVRGVSFDVCAGEIVGIAAVEGSGQSILLRAVAGLRSVSGGIVQRPHEVGFVPEDRQGEALLSDASLTENYALRSAGIRRGRVNWREMAVRTAEVLTRRDVRAAGPHARARTLSGGNQQRFVLARSLDDAPPAMVIENPTRGLDFRATAAVHAALKDARDSGVAILFYSSDLDEVLALADRVLVLHNGTIRQVEGDRELVGRAMLGLA